MPGESKKTLLSRLPPMSLSELTAIWIDLAIEACSGNQTHAALLLEISVCKLRRHILYKSKLNRDYIVGRPRKTDD